MRNKRSNRGLNLKLIRLFWFVKFLKWVKNNYYFWREKCRLDFSSAKNIYICKISVFVLHELQKMYLNLHGSHPILLLSIDKSQCTPQYRGRGTVYFQVKQQKKIRTYDFFLLKISLILIGWTNASQVNMIAWKDLQLVYNVFVWTRMIQMMLEIKKGKF